MGTHSAGFTVIETMLFLAISGLMMVTMIAGTSLSLNTQRYRDAVESFKTILQEQYAELSSTENDRPSTLSCGLDNTATPVGQQSNTQIRGQSRCELFGRYVRISGGDIAVYPLLAYRVAAYKPVTGTDITYMQNQNYFRIGVDVEAREESKMEWGTAIAWPSDGYGEGPVGRRDLSILFVRSPESGQVYTFSTSDIPQSTTDVSQTFLRGMIATGNQAALPICISSEGLLSNETSSIFLRSQATGANSIETQTDDSYPIIGLDTVCRRTFL